MGKGKEDEELIKIAVRDKIKNIHEVGLNLLTFNCKPIILRSGPECWRGQANQPQIILGILCCENVGTWSVNIYFFHVFLFENNNFQNITAVLTMENTSWPKGRRHIPHSNGEIAWVEEDFCNLKMSFSVCNCLCSGRNVVDTDKWSDSLEDAEMNINKKCFHKIIHHSIFEA